MKDRSLTEQDNFRSVNNAGNILDICEHNEISVHGEFVTYGYWDDHTLDQKQASENLLEALLGFIPNKSGKILVVGCGVGRNTQYLLKYYNPYNVVGIDISLLQFKTDQTKEKSGVFLLMDSVELGFKNSSFEHILCVEAAFHVSTRKKFFQEAMRVLKPGGYLVLSDILMSPEAEEKKHYWTETYYLSSPGEYDSCLREAGFQDVKVIDATASCWKGAYWNAVRYFHQQFLAKKFDLAQLKNALDLTYRRVLDTKYYLLAAAGKP